MAERLLRVSLQVSERRAAIARTLPEPDLTSIDSLGTDYNHLGLLLLDQRKPECVPYLEKALASFEEAKAPDGSARAAGTAGTWLPERTLPPVEDA